MTSSTSPVLRRLMIVVALLLLVSAALVTFIPASPQGAGCGTWVAPAYDEDELQGLLDKGAAAADSVRGLGDEGADMAADLDSQAVSLARTYRDCSDSLSTRRTVALVLLAGGVLVPLIALFVTGGFPRRRREEGSADLA